jgi:N4-gp56 family major capsid protein
LIDATVSFYGLYTAINQQVTLQNQDPVLLENAELLGLSLRMTEDELTRDCLRSSASVYNCVGGLNGDFPTNLSLFDNDRVTAMLLTNDAWRMFRAIGGENKFGTGPTRDAYLALGHTNLSQDLNAVNGVVPKWNYPNSGAGVLESEWAALNNVRFMLSSVGSVVPNASAMQADVYNIFYQGMESLATIYQDNFSSRFYYRPPVYSDPLFQNVTLGYVTAMVPTILNDLWIKVVNCTLR